MVEIVGTAELIITPEKSVLLVDGKEFPFHIAADEIEVVSLPNGVSFFRVSIYANSVQVRADLGVKGSVSVDVGAETNTSWGKVGDTLLVQSDTPAPEGHILAFNDPNVRSDDVLSYLVRAPGSRVEQDKWSWSSSPDSKGLNPIPWSHLRVKNINTELQIVKVK